MQVFNLSSGYSGTAFAATLLTQSPDYLAEHEAQPTLFGPWTALWNETDGPPEGEIAEAVRHKFAVADQRRETAGKAHYADTSHGFIKGWGPAAIGLGLISPENTRLIHTFRHPAKVTRSIVALRMIPGGAVFPCDHYWLDPHADRNCIHLTTKDVQVVLEAVQPICNDGFIATQLIQAAWYVLEIEARIHAFRASYPDFEIFTLDIDRPEDEHIAGFYRHCGVQTPAQWSPDAVNAKRHLYDVQLEWAMCAYEHLHSQVSRSTAPIPPLRNKACSRSMADHSNG